MPGFFNLPGEARNKIYDELLVYRKPISCLLSSVSHPLLRDLLHPSGLSVALLLLDRQAYREASSVLYSGNCFEASNCSTLASFIKHIGPQNVELLRRLAVPFPDFHYGEQGVDISLLERDTQLLDLISQKCHNIVSLEMSLSTTHAMELRLDKLDNPRAVDRVLAQIDARFRSIASLQEIRVHVYNGPFNLALRAKMRGYGWIVQTTEREDWETDEVSDDDEYSNGNTVYEM